MHCGSHAGRHSEVHCCDFEAVKLHVSEHTKINKLSLVTFFNKARYRMCPSNLVFVEACANTKC